MRTAMIDTATHLVSNVIELAKLEDFTAPAGMTLVASEAANIGDTYDPAHQSFTPPAAPTPPAPTQATYLAAVGAMLDATVQERFYDNIVSACSYAASTNVKFKAEADACVAWRDAVYTACYAALAAVQGGTMEQPTVEAFIASLPTLTWPQEPTS